jgi:hypothetical protein
MNADDKYQYADRERWHHNRHIEHIGFYIVEYTLIELHAFLMCSNVPVVQKIYGAE